MIARLLLPLVFAAGGASAHVGPHPEAGIAFDQHIGAHVDRSLGFEDGSGARTTLGNAMAAKPTILLMGYLRCRDLCAVTLPGVAEALAQSGLEPARDYRVVFASIDAREDGEVLASGPHRVPAAQRTAWSFVGGDAASAHALANAVGFRYRYEPEREAFAHPEGIVVLSPDGLVSRYFFGVRFDPTDVRLAVTEAAGGRTGRLSDRLLLLCYHYDPTTGKYTARVIDAMRAAGSIFLVASGFLGWRMLRRPRGAERAR